jgi:hypothetical protein
MDLSLQAVWSLHWGPIDHAGADTDCAASLSKVDVDAGGAGAVNFEAT